MRIRRCRECGFPRSLSKVLKWNNNGTISFTPRKDFYDVLIEADFLSEVFKRIEEKLGVSIQHIVFETERNVIYKSMSGYTEIFPLNILKRMPGGKRLAVKMVARLGGSAGQCNIKIMDYRPGRSMEVILRNPFNRELISAVIVGALEALDNVPFSHTRKTVDGDDVISIRPEPSRPKIAERLTFDTAPAKPGNRSYPLCSRCGVPIQMKDLEWRGDEGIIMDVHRKVRMIFFDSYVPSVVFRELAKELGEEVYPIIIDAQRSLSLKNIRGEFLSALEPGKEMGRDNLYSSVLDTLALRGQGNPVEYSSDGERLSVTMENPFNEYLLAGHLSALYELGEEREASASWEYLDPSTIRFTLLPKNSIN